MKKIDVSNESIELVGTSSTDVGSLAQAISDSEPRYSFFRYSHESEGQAASPILFIYTCPSRSKIKERMMYASSRAGIIAAAKSEAGIEASKKVSLPLANAALAEDSRSKRQCLQRLLQVLYTKNSTPKSSKSKPFRGQSGQASGSRSQILIYMRTLATQQSLYNL